jgi:hypothetical protein
VLGTLLVLRVLLSVFLRLVVFHKPKLALLFLPLELQCLLRQCLYFCTSKASKLRTPNSARRRIRRASMKPTATQLLWCQYLCFCTSISSTCALEKQVYLQAGDGAPSVVRD